MNRGKHICNQLKAVRRRIAEENDIPLEIKECTHDGPCRGSCPRCEAEVRYLEQELQRRSSMGKAVAVAGVALGMAIGGSASAQTPVAPTHPVEVADTVDNEELILGMLDPEPEFPGGIEALYKFLAENIKYPTEAKEKRIQGKVYVTFVVDTDGSIRDARVLRDIGGGCGEEALRVVNLMPKWIPATRHPVQYSLPINFTLEE